MTSHFARCTTTRHPTLCRTQRRAQVVTIDGYEDIPPGDEQLLKKAVAHQPVAIAIDASCMDFHLYSEGVFTNDCGEDLDHGVLAVGYGQMTEEEAQVRQRRSMAWVQSIAAPIYAQPPRSLTSG